MQISKLSFPLLLTLALGFPGIVLPAQAADVPATAGPPTEGPPTPTEEETGLASVYSSKMSGQSTASGKKYDPMQLTAAHKTLPFGTDIRVTNEKNGKTVEVRINDRGPRQAKRILYITPRAAKELGMSRRSITEVSIKVVPK